MECVGRHGDARPPNRCQYFDSGTNSENCDGQGDSDDVCVCENLPSIAGTEHLCELHFDTGDFEATTNHRQCRCIQNNVVRGGTNVATNGDGASSFSGAAGPAAASVIGMVVLLIGVVILMVARRSAKSPVETTPYPLQNDIDHDDFEEMAWDSR